MGASSTASNTQPSTTGPTSSCNVCLMQFAAAGGCNAMPAGADASSYLPEGCDQCGDEAAQYCATQPTTTNANFLQRNKASLLTMNACTAAVVMVRFQVGIVLGTSPSELRKGTGPRCAKVTAPTPAVRTFTVCCPPAMPAVAHRVCMQA